MKTLTKLTTTTLSLAAILTLSACGDIASLGSSNSVDTTAISGLAVDPELVGATVFVDANENEAFDEGETYTTTDESGAFTLAIENSDLNKPIMVINGVDRVTQEEFTGSFSALIDTNSITQNITPLTTLVHQYHKRNGDKSLKQIKSEIAASLDLNISALDANPMESAAILKVALQLQSVAELANGSKPHDVYKLYAQELENGATLTTMLEGVASSEGLSLDELTQAKIVTLNSTFGLLTSMNARSDALALSVDNIKKEIDRAKHGDDLEHDFAHDEELLVRDDEADREIIRRENVRENELKGEIDVDDYPHSELNSEVKYTLAYMWNEERVAYDIYNALGTLNPDIMVFTNIAERAEAKHIELVENLVKKYDLNITNLVDYSQNYSLEELRSFKAGEYSIGELQELYNSLYEKGKASPQAALEVGCMVEVTDINDLDRDILLAQSINADDVVTVFENLRNGSYSHYFAFDKALVNLGVSEGCAILGSDYDKRDVYPQQEHGSEGMQDNMAHGEGMQKGKH